jgi:OOP family OmpA-OmpF porin
MTRLISAALFLALATSLRTAGATQCHPENGLSPCVDADALWFPAGRAHFAAISGAYATRPGTLSLGLANAYLKQPVVLVVPSPDPEGRRVQVVSHALNSTLLLAYGLFEGLELTLAAPVTLDQAGAGVEGLTTQSGPPLAHTSFRDPRIGLGYEPGPGTSWLKAKPKFELKLPLGDESLLSGEDSFVAAPGLAVGLQWQRWRAGLELGLRLRSSVELGGVLLGSQAFAALGARLDLVEGGLLSLGLEAWALPSLIEQPGDSAPSSVTAARHVSSEWLASVGSWFAPHSPVHALLGFGTALPLASETRRGPDGESETEYFAGLGTPAFRLVLSLFYSPR